MDMKTKYDKQQKLIIFVVIATAFIGSFTGSALNLSIPDMGKEFHVSAGTVGWLITGYMLTMSALSVPFGRIADMTSRKKVMTAGLAVFTVSTAAGMFGTSMWMVLAARIVQGVGGAMIFSTNIAILISAFPGKERGKVLGYSIASTYVGLSAGPVAGGLLNSAFGWRSIFAVTALISLTALILSWTKLPDKRENQGERSYDTAGNVLFVGMIVCLMYGFSDFSLKPVPVILTAAGILLGILFVRRELSVSNPVIKVRIFRENIAYSLSNLAALMNYGATFALSYLLSIYLQVVMGYSSRAAGLILIVQPALMAVLSPYAGRLSDKISPFKLASLGMGLCAAGVFICSFITENTHLSVVIVALAVTGVGFALFSSPNTNAVMACVEPADYGVASSILSTMRSIGHTVSMVIVTFIISRYMGTAALADASPAELIKVMHTAFLIYTGLCIVGVFFSLKRKKQQ